MGLVAGLQIRPLARAGQLQIRSLEATEAPQNSHCTVSPGDLHGPKRIHVQQTANSKEGAFKPLRRHSHHKAVSQTKAKRRHSSNQVQYCNDTQTSPAKHSTSAFSRAWAASAEMNRPGCRFQYCTIQNSVVQHFKYCCVEHCAILCCASAPARSARRAFWRAGRAFSRAWDASVEIR